jgi:UDP-N-acetylglucosamine acyltransferase
MADIHPTAVIEDGAEIAADVTVGPYCVIGKKVRLMTGVRLHAHVAVSGVTAIGENTEIFPFASIGAAPQHIKYAGEDTRLEIGKNCIIREYATANPGTVTGDGLTTIGDGCMLMMGAHVAHDCRVGDGAMLVNNATLGGHCVIGEHAILGGLCAIHQFVRIGEYAFVGGMAAVDRDVIPYGMVLGDRAHLGGLNIVGMKRHDMPRQQIHAMRSAYRRLFTGQGTLKDRVEEVAEAFAGDDNVQRIIAFLRAGGDRSIITPRSGRQG